jgi:DNA-directed RNA polymerase subunit RPC12/RpoP
MSLQQFQQLLPICPLCKSTSGYKISGTFNKYTQCNYCDAKWKLKIKNQQITELALWKLPKVGTALCRVPSLDVPVYLKVTDFMSLQVWQNLNLNYLIQLEFLSRFVEPSMLSGIMLKKTEKPIISWRGVCGAMEGALLLTSQRFIWLKQRSAGSGSNEPTYQVGFDIVLGDVKGITADEGGEGTELYARKQVVIATPDGDKIFSLGWAMTEIIRLLTELVINARREEIAAARKKDKIHIIMDFSFLKSTMEKGGVLMQVIKCPECGASMDFPKTGNQTQCQHCGKNIYAQDIFEKVKDLL